MSMLLAVRLAVNFRDSKIRELSLKYQEKMSRIPKKGGFGSVAWDFIRGFAPRYPPGFNRFCASRIGPFNAGCGKVSKTATMIPT